MEIDFDASHKVINEFTQALQYNFKEDTQYKHALITPQVNILFAFDREAADNMIGYMSDKLMRLAGFGEHEFRFICRSNGDGEGLQRIRLEFTKGVTSEVIYKITIATDELKKYLSSGA